MRWPFVVTCAACGRINFDPLPGPDAAPRCDPSAPFTSVTALDELNSPVDGQGGVRLTSDELVAMWHTTRMGSPYTLYMAMRTSRFVPFDPPFDTTIPGFFPSLSADRLTLVFDDFVDLKVATRMIDAEPFGTSTKLPVVNTSAQEVASLLDASETLLYFTRSAATQDMFVADWPPTMEKPIAELNSAVDYESSPTISADGLTIYYAQRAATATQADIWTARRASKDVPFEQPSRVADVSSPDEDSPDWLSPDNCRLYIESRRGASVDYRLYVAERQP